MSEIMRERWKDPEFRAKQWTPEQRAKASAALSGKKVTGERLEKLRASRRSVEYREKRRLIALKNWSDQDYRANVMRGVRSGRLEDQLAAVLDEAGIEYERQVRFDRYRSDFVLEGRLVCEVFGCYFHACPKHGKDYRAHMHEYDAKRLAVIESKGYATLVVWEHDLRADPAGVLDAVHAALGAVTT